MSTPRLPPPLQGLLDAFCALDAAAGFLTRKRVAVTARLLLAAASGLRTGGPVSLDDLRRLLSVSPSTFALAAAEAGVVVSLQPPGWGVSAVAKRKAAVLEALCARAGEEEEAEDGQPAQKRPRGSSSPLGTISAVELAPWEWGGEPGLGADWGATLLQQGASESLQSPPRQQIAICTNLSPERAAVIEAAYANASGSGAPLAIQRAGGVAFDILDQLAPCAAASPAEGFSSASSNVASNAADVRDLPAFLRRLPHYDDQAAHVIATAGRPARCELLPADVALPAAVWTALRARNITDLFRHQALAISGSLRGKHVVLSTATSSGKSLCFHAPVFTSLLATPAATALYIFPTKALAQDQLRSLVELTQSSDALSHAVRPAVLDGDTSFADRDVIRSIGNLVLCNPDILHATVLPFHADWARIIRGLSFIVLDEAHAYKGVFGAHVGLVLRRLLRLCARYGSRPQFVVCSATIANPLAMFRALVPRSRETDPRGGSSDDEVVLISSDEDGSAVGSRTVVVWVPPLIHGGVKGLENASADDSGGEDSPFGTGGAGAGAGAWTEDDSAGDSAVLRGEAGRKADVAVALKALLQRAGTGAAASAPRSAVEGVDAGGCPIVRGPQWLQDLLRNDMLPERSKTEVARVLGIRHPVPGPRPPPLWVRQVQEKQAAEGTARRRSPLVETALLVVELMRAGFRSLVFVRARNVAEILVQYVHERLVTEDAPHLIHACKSYRAGHLKEERRAVEGALFRGDVLACVTTNALELGVDIGSLDVVVTLGWPGSASSFAQQAGRAGRGGKDAATIVVTYDSPIDALLVRDPAALLARTPEAVHVDVSNTHLLLMHAGFASAEAPLCPWDVNLMGPGLCGAVRQLRADNALLQDDRGEGPGVGLGLYLGHEATARKWGTVSRSHAAAAIPGLDSQAWRAEAAEGGGSGRALHAWRAAKWSVQSERKGIRQIDSVEFTVMEEGGRTLSTIEACKVLHEAHEGAMLPLQGVTYLVQKLDRAALTVVVRKSRAPYFTRLCDRTAVDCSLRAVSTLDGRMHAGPCTVSMTPYGYTKHARRTTKLLSFEPLPGLQPLSYDSSAAWFDAPLALVEEMCAQSLCVQGACHAAGHAILSVLPLFVLCDRADLGTECPGPRGAPRPARVIVYDVAKGGVGLSRAAFDAARPLLQAALDLLRACPCDNGCMRCCYDPACTELNIVMDKAGGVLLLASVLGGP